MATRKFSPHLKKANIYPGFKINKNECATHLSKRACSSIFKFGSTWQTASSTAITKPSDKATSKGANTLQKAAKGCAPITSYFQTDKPVTNEQPVSTEQLQQPISTEHIVSTEQPISSEQHELPVSSKQL